MEVTQGGSRHPVAAAVLRAVSQHRAVRADGCCDPALPAVDSKLVAHLPGDADAARDQPLGLVAGHARAFESRDTRLITGGRCHCGPCLVVSAMHGSDLTRCVLQQSGRPERIGQVVPAVLQSVRHSAVQDDRMLETQHAGKHPLTILRQVVTSSWSSLFGTESRLPGHTDRALPTGPEYSAGLADQVGDFVGAAPGNGDTSAAVAVAVHDQAVADADALATDRGTGWAETDAMAKHLRVAQRRNHRRRTVEDLGGG